MANWDVFHAETLELERGLSTAAVRQALARSSVSEDDLVRPAGTNTPWARIGDIAELAAAEVAPAEPPPTAPRPSGKPASARVPSDFELVADEGLTPPPAATIRSPDWLELRSESDDVAFPVIKDPITPPAAAPKPPEPHPSPAAPSSKTEDWLWAEEVDDDDDDDDDDEDVLVLEEALPPPPVERAPARPVERAPARPVERAPARATRPPDLGEDDLELTDAPSRIALPVVSSRDRDDAMVSGDEEDFTFARGGPMTVEELDLAPMVDVAFQLVLFFMVTATTVIYKTLEIPKPSPENAPSAVSQGRSKEDLEKDYVLVEIDPSGSVKIDHEPVAADLGVLVERLRTAREKTGRTSMLLTADYTTKHRNTVLAYDAAHEIGMGIVIGKPTPPAAAGPTLGVAPSGPAAPKAAAPPN